MSKITIMSGLSGSGKSTKAKEIIETNGNTIRINKDLLREMFHFNKFNFNNEDITQKASMLLAEHFLQNNVNVIIDDTNLNPKTKDKYKELGKKLNCKIEYVDIDTPFEECVERDMSRMEDNERFVGREVILKQALQYKELWKDKQVVICDLDGTLCDIQHRLHFVKVAEGEKKDWKSFFDGIEDDSVNGDVFHSLMRLKRQIGDVKIIFVSARPEEYRFETEKWFNLFRYNAKYGDDFLEMIGNDKNSKLNLIMRETGDKRDDVEVKEDIYNKYLKHLNIIKVFDDRPRVIRMWQSKGLDVEDCGDGIEF